MRRRARGFTLIEVLLATALPALRLLQKPIALLLQGRAT